MPRTFFKSEDPEDTGITHLGDNDPCPFGKWEGTQMKGVPDEYLIFMRDNLQQREDSGQKLRDDETAFFNYALGRLVD